MTHNAPPDDITMPIKEEDLYEVDPNDGRGDTRFPWRTTIDVDVRDRTMSFETVNVSLGGIFVLAKILPRLGATVRVRMRLPPESEFVELDCVVRHVIEPDLALDAPPGFGLELAVPIETRARWGRFIEYLAQALHASATLRSTAAARPDSLTKVLLSEVFERLNEIQAKLAPTLEESGETRALSGDELTRLLEGTNGE